MPLPYTENFDIALAPDLPDCTYSYKQTFVGSDWDCSIAPNNSFTGNVGRYSTYSDVGWGMTCDFVLRPVQLTAGATYKVSYKYANEDNQAAIDFLRVSLSSADAEIQIPLELHESISGVSPVTHSVEFTITATATYYLRFSLETSGNQGILYLDDIKIEETGTTGIPGHELAGISCYPNPVKDRLTITNTTGSEELELYSITGQLLHTQPSSGNDTVMNFENFPAGIYILKTSLQRSNKTIRLIKE
ncbi:MAG: hypothetical protein DI539_10390 [Flavobacterium psychrophilum]|nr:MAG: hypothetical protein DI539_10390 [Flavobacterium psychrophilum]